MAVTTFDSLPIGLFTKSLKEVFVNEAQRVEDFISRLYNVSTTDLITNTYQGFAGLGTASSWDGESTVEYDNLTTRYETSITQVFWRKAIKYTWKMKQYEQYGMMKEMVKSLATAMAQTKQVYAASFLNSQLAGTGTKWNTTEAKYLFDDAHPLAVAGGTASNKVTGALSVTKLQEAIYLLTITPDDQGIPMGLKPKRLWVHPYNYATAIEVVNKGVGLRSDSEYRKKNTFDEYGLDVIACPYLTDTDGWLLQADRFKTICEVSVALEQNQWVDNDDRGTVHDAIFAFNVGATDWRGWVGSQGA